MNKLAVILTHLKENKAFYMILVLNFALSFGLLYFIQNYNLIENRIEIQEDMNIGHQELDSLSTVLQYKSKWYLSATSVRVAIQAKFNNDQGRFFISRIGSKILPNMTCKPIANFLKWQMVSEFQKK